MTIPCTLAKNVQELTVDPNIRTSNIVSKKNKKCRLKSSQENVGYLPAVSLVAGTYSILDRLAESKLEKNSKPAHWISSSIPTDHYTRK